MNEFDDMANVISEEENVKTEQIEKKEPLFKWYEFACVVVAACVFALLMFKVIFGIVYVPSSSMEPTLRPGNVRFTYNLPYTFGDPVPERGTIVVFYDEEVDLLLVKRLIGVSGDEVAVKDGGVYVNGEKLDEPYVQGTTVDSGNGPIYNVPEGYFFALGDNREGSWDSRYLKEPFIPVQNIVGVIRQ